MTRSVRQLLLYLVAGLLFFIQPSTSDRSVSNIGGPGWEFAPLDSSLPPLLTFTAKNLLYCSLQCNQRTDCRTFDFDSGSRQCRLWDCDMTTGSIVASPSKPQSVVGTIQLSSSLYANIYNQSCNACVQSRYLTCNVNSSTCQCPLKSFWNGLICSAQLLPNQTCSQADACRSDLNLTCAPSCDFTYRCSTIPAIGAGQTVAGFCNATLGSGSNDLGGPWGIYVSPSDGSLYVTDYDRLRFQLFSPFSRTGSILFSSGLIQPVDVFVDNSGAIYMVDGGNSNNAFVYIQRAGVILRSFPAAGLSTLACLFTGIHGAYGIAVDLSGNMYISLYYCFMVVKWAPNANNGTLVAGMRGISGTNSTMFGSVRFIYLDEVRGALYVTDNDNNRIQKFIIGANGMGVTVAGNETPGTGLTQLNEPAGICVTSDGQTLYVADYGNNRIMKWVIGASQGSVVAGSASGASGSTSQLLNGPADVALDPSETYLYVSDYFNHRIQRFRLQ